MKRTQKLLSITLALILVLSMFAGSVVFGANAKSSSFVPASFLQRGDDYLITTEVDGTRYALAYDGQEYFAQEVTVTDGQITVTDDKAVWTPGEESSLESVGTPGTFIFPGSNGFITYTSGRTFVYDPDSETVYMHSMYYLTFDAETHLFGQSKEGSDAAKIQIYQRIPLYTKTTDAFVKDYQYVITTEVDGKIMALAYQDEELAAVEVTVNDDIVQPPMSAVWTAGPDNTMENVGTPGMFLYPNSTKFMAYTSGREIVYDGETQTVQMHGVYYLVWNAETGLFDENSDAAAACKVTIYGREMPSTEVEEKYIPDGSDIPTEVRSAKASNDGNINLAFVSDIHYSNDYRQNNLQVWYDNVSKDIGYIDALGSCGDMGSAYSSTAEIYWNNVQSVFNYMDPIVAAGKIGSAIYTFGNHEWAPSNGGNFTDYYENSTAMRYMRVGEALKTDRYIIYCLGAGPMAAKNGAGYSDEDIARIEEYLNAAPTDIPIFVLTHFPLHYWGERMASNAAKLVGVLNEHPNVVVLWGHNHSDFDQNYDKVYRPGSVLPVDNQGTELTFNFTYLSAGCVSDFEYTGPDGGSAWVQGKGLITTINADGSLTFNYYDMQGNKMPEKGPYLVEFRDNIYYETFERQYVNGGSAAQTPAAPVIDQFTFKGFDIAFDNITCHKVITAQYDFTPEATGYVYLTVTKDGKAYTGKSGKPIVSYPIPYTEGMTVTDAFEALHNAEYEGEGTFATGSTKYFAGVWTYFTDILGESGGPIYNYSVDALRGFEDVRNPAVNGNTYYMTLDSNRASFLTPNKGSVKAGETVTFVARDWQYQVSRIFMEFILNGDVYCGTTPYNMTDTGIDTVDGAFTLTMDKPGTYYVAVRAPEVADAYAIVTVAENGTPAGKTDAEKVEDLIAAIGTVTKDSGMAIEKARMAYDALADGEKANVKNYDALVAAEKAYNELITAEPTYEMTAGNNAKYTKGSKKNLVFRADAPYSAFTGVNIDDKPLDQKYFSAKDGTEVEISADALEALAEGKHTITLTFEGGKVVVGSFTVEKASATPDNPSKDDPKSPSTGDRNWIPLFVVLMLVSGGALFFIFYKTRKNKER